MDVPDNAIHPKSRAAWRQWLQKRHACQPMAQVIAQRSHPERALARKLHPGVYPKLSPVLIRRRCLIALLLLLPVRTRATPALQHAMQRARALRDAAVRAGEEAGSPVNGRDARGRNAVLAATQGGHVETARLLIARGADVNAQDDIRDSAFLLAGARGHTEIVRVALAAGADLKSTNRYGGAALIPACHYGHVDTVRLLLTTAIDVNHINNLGWSALLEAVILGDGGTRHSEIVKLLIAHGANVNLADKQGVTPLAHAEQRGQRAISDLLRAAGARSR
jgi:uncharacterized protein